MDYGFDGKVAVVTGAGGGVGYAISKMFVQENCKVFGVDLKPEALSAIGGPDMIQGYACDLSTVDGPGKAIEAALAAFGRVDILVNNAAIAPNRDSFLDVTEDDWKKVMDLDFYAMVRACRAVIPHMIQRGSGSIVTIASDEGRQPDVYFCDYSVAKAAVLNLSKTLSIEFGPKGIRVNTVSPGPTRTAIWDMDGGFADYLIEYLGAKDREDAIMRFIKEVRRMPIERIGLPEDVAAVVLFLASDLAKQVTGSDYWCNGGTMLSI